jgi:hypothetical protein
MRRNVDIRRETLLQELCELSETFNIEQVVERLHKQSAQMIKEIDACDKEFRDKFKEIRIRPIEYDAHGEKRRLYDEFKNISKKTIANMKYENELRIEELIQRRLHLSLIENALNKNHFFSNENNEEADLSKRFASLGEISLSTNNLPDSFSFKAPNVMLTENQSVITTSLQQNKNSV